MPQTAREALPVNGTSKTVLATEALPTVDSDLVVAFEDGRVVQARENAYDPD